MGPIEQVRYPGEGEWGKGKKWGMRKVAFHPDAFRLRKWSCCLKPGGNHMSEVHWYVPL